MFYFWGYSSAFVVYSALCYFWPAESTMVAKTIYDDSDDVSSGSMEKVDSDTPYEKTPVEIVQEKV